MTKDKLRQELIASKKLDYKTCRLCKNTDTSVQPVEIDKDNNFCDRQENSIIDRTINMIVCHCGNKFKVQEVTKEDLELTEGQLILLPL